MEFETAYDAEFKDRYGNNPFYCDIYGNHIDFNTRNRSSGVYYWTGNLSAYNTNNKRWLFVPAGTTVTMKVTVDAAASNRSFQLKDEGGTTRISCNVHSSASVTNSYTSAQDEYLWLTFSTTLQTTATQSVDVEIYLDGKRVL